MKRLLLLLMLLAFPAMAQEIVHKLVTLKYADPQSIMNLLRNFGVEVTIDRQMRVIALSGPQAKVTTAEDAIKQLDIPSAGQKNIELTVFFVAGSDAAAEPGAAPVPQDLQSTIAALKGTFSFKNYTLLDVLSIRTRSGVGASTTGELAQRRISEFRIRSASVEGDGSIIRLDQLHAGIRIPVAAGEGKINYIDTGISTDVVDVKEGQKLVVGRSSLDGPQKALFLILIARVQ